MASFSGNIHRFVILGRSKERSDAAQTLGSMPRLQSPAAVLNSAPLHPHERPGMDPRVFASATLPLRPWMTKLGTDQNHLSGLRNPCPALAMRRHLCLSSPSTLRSPHHEHRPQDARATGRQSER
ncbi:MAG: hypothetical protein E5Y30_18410 [Mesorhizobium sp.]|nr:MAG: hypothetical protein E5Y30_18410 [Mesorhizobium sp.]